MKRAANKSIRVSTLPSTPKRRRAFDKLKDAIKMSKKHPDMINYKYKLKNRRQELSHAIKEHKEKEIKEFFKNLNDFDVGQRIRKTYNYLKGFVKQKHKKIVNISTRVWNQMLRESEGPEIEYCEKQDYTPLIQPPTAEEIMDIIRESSNRKSAGPDHIYMEYIKNADEDTQKTIIKIIQKAFIENELPSDWLKSTQIPIPKKQEHQKQTISEGFRYVVWFIKFTLSG